MVEKCVNLIRDGKFCKILARSFQIFRFCNDMKKKILHLEEVWRIETISADFSNWLLPRSVGLSAVIKDGEPSVVWLIME